MKRKFDQLQHLLSKIRSVFWDIDGTLFSSQEILHGTYIECFEEFKRRHKRSCRVPTEDEVIGLIGRPTAEIFLKLAPELSREERNKLSDCVLNRLVKRIEQGDGLHYEGARETLLTLSQRSYNFFAASNGRLPYVKAILRTNRVISCFREVEAIDGKVVKNKSELVLQTLTRHALKPSEALIVGDRSSDRDAASATGIHFIAATYGHGEASEWESAIIKIDKVKELLDLLPPR